MRSEFMFFLSWIKNWLYSRKGRDCRSFSKLEKKGNQFTVTGRIPFRVDGTLKPKTVESVFDFAYRMAFTAEGEHRRHRSGGERLRRNSEIFANTFQGKIAECAACNFLYKYDESVCPDFSVSKLGEWDSVDITARGKEIAIKSTKHYGQLLLLETKDWDRRGNYKPNIGRTTASYDYLFLIRLKPSCEDILRQMRMLYSDSVDRDKLFTIVSSYDELRA